MSCELDAYDELHDDAQYGGHECRIEAVHDVHECRCGLQWWVDLQGKVTKQAVKPTSPPAFELAETPE